MSAADSCARGCAVAYEIVASPCLICGFEAITVYGLRAVADDGQAGSLEIADISTDRTDVDRLISRLNDKDVSSEQLLYIVEDYVSEINS